MITHGQKIAWNDRNGYHAVEVSGYATAEEAKAEAIISAGGLGWTPPKWWQWWRWGDRDYAKD
jgi:hypothetical protein